MSTELRISDACPHCGQQVMVALANVQPAPGGGPEGPYVGMTVLVDPNAARVRAADPSADHPCPGPPGQAQPTPAAPVALGGAVPEDHAS